MTPVESQITSLTIVCSTVYSRRRSKKTSKLRVNGLCAGNSPVTGEFPAQRASNAENVSIWWRHNVLVAWCRGYRRSNGTSRAEPWHWSIYLALSDLSTARDNYTISQQLSNPHEWYLICRFVTEFVITDAAHSCTTALARKDLSRHCGCRSVSSVCPTGGVS